MVGEFRIPALKTANGAVIHPEFWLGEAAAMDRGVEVHDTRSWPSLGEFNHAYFGKERGSYVSPEFRRDVREFKNYKHPGNPSRNYVTSTCLLDGATLIIKPKAIGVNYGNEFVEGGTGVEVEVPKKDFWVAELDPYTGFPSRPAKSWDESLKALGEPVRFVYFGDSGERLPSKLTTIAVYWGNHVTIDASDKLAEISRPLIRACRRAQFDQAAYESFMRAQEQFADEIKGMDLDGLKARMRSDPDFARRFDDYMAAQKALRSELE